MPAVQWSEQVREKEREKGSEPGFSDRGGLYGIWAAKKQLLLICYLFVMSELAHFFKDHFLLSAYKTKCQALLHVLASSSLIACAVF